MKEKSLLIYLFIYLLLFKCQLTLHLYFWFKETYPLTVCDLRTIVICELKYLENL